MKKILALFIAVVLFSFNLVSCNANTSNDRIELSFKGTIHSFLETERYIYCVSSQPSDHSSDSAYTISSFEKNGKKRFEIPQHVSGEVFSLKDDTFFYASKTGEIYSYDQNGKLRCKTEIPIDEHSNSNYLLNSNDELIINTIASPATSTTYTIIKHDGSMIVSQENPHLTTCFTYTYPNGGYISTGFSDDSQWYINRLAEDFSLLWTYTAQENNVSIDDISKDGKILFHGFIEDQASMKELDSSGNVVNSTTYSSSSLQAKYFMDKIVVHADTLKILDSNFHTLSEYEKMLFPQIKIVQNSLFIYSGGAYKPTDSVTFDGYCKKYDENGALQLNKSFKSFKDTDGFFEVSDSGKLIYSK